MAAEHAPGSPYLDSLDSLLRSGMTGLTEALTAPQVAFALERQQPDGGFPGSRGPSDLYYTDFALRLLDPIGPADLDLAPVARFVASAPPPTDVVHCFSLLSCARMLAGHSLPVEVDRSDLLTVLAEHAAYGGPARREEDRDVPFSVTRAFLGALSYQLLDERPPDVTQVLRSLRRPDGGFADGPDREAGQTNATAAAVALLTMAGALKPAEATGAAGFLAAMQTPSGGVRAHALAPVGDLLSTFTALVTLVACGDPGALDLRAAARFVRDLAVADGGFRGTVGDEADIEYTYYGLGCLALLRAGARSTRENEPP